MEENKMSMPLAVIQSLKWEFEGKIKELLKEFHEKSGHYINSIEIAEGKIDADTVKAKVKIEL